MALRYSNAIQIDVLSDTVIVVGAGLLIDGHRDVLLITRIISSHIGASPNVSPWIGLRSSRMRVCGVLVKAKPNN
jgi:hypothetical protein